MGYTYKEVELMTENATLAERCIQLEKQVKLYADIVAILARDKITVPPMVSPNTTFPFRPEYSLSQGCPKCGIGADGKPMGYVCNRTDCPTGVSC